MDKHYKDYIQIVLNIMRYRKEQGLTQDQLSGVFFHVNLMDADLLAAALRFDLHIPIPADGRVQLGDLIVLDYCNYVFLRITCIGGRSSPL